MHAGDGIDPSRETEARQFVAVAPEDAGNQFSWLANLLSMDCLASSTLTGALLGWEPTGPGLIEDLDQGHYFHDPAA